MKVSRALILGLDPGMTVGYALLDMKGGIVEIFSRKHFSLSSLISSVMRHGDVEIVATDISLVPKAVLRISAKLGARIVKPIEDLTLRKKRVLVKRFVKGLDMAGLKLKNKHELSALASAVFAWKGVRLGSRYDL